MKKILKIVGIALTVLILAISLLIILVIVSDNGKITLPVKKKPAFSISENSSLPSRLVVKDNEIFNEEGEKIRFKGLMPADPARLKNRNMFKEDIFVDISKTGANVIRIPVHPENWVSDEYYLWRYLDPIVKWAGELDMYVIIDLHYIGNIETGRGSEMPEIEEHPKELALQFWEDVSSYFKDTPHVIYEIFNEPQSISSDVWRKNAIDLIEVIRNNGSNQLILVGGIDYSRDLSWVLDDPIDDINLGYVSHIYPAHSKLLWDKYFGKVSEVYPVVITECGFMVENRRADYSFLAGNEENYGIPFFKYLDEMNIGWVACWFDDEWMPQIFKEDFKGYTKYGEFIMKKLKE